MVTIQHQILESPQAAAQTDPEIPIKRREMRTSTTHYSAEHNSVNKNWGLMFKNQCVVIPELVVMQSVVQREQVAVLPWEVSPGLKDISLELPGKKS